ncbi:MAG: hypothetical protein ACREP2_02365 [Rhodanobacteraceae bacterium]
MQWQTEHVTSIRIAMPSLAACALASAGKPFRGNKSVDVKDDSGVPLHAELTWTFTPYKG